jgi:uncharacterized protein
MTRLIILIFFILIIDVYVFRTFQKQFSGMAATVKYSIYTVYWLIPVALFISGVLLAIASSSSEIRPEKLIFYTASLMVVSYLPKSFIILFQIIEDLGKIIVWFIKKISETENALFQLADRFSKNSLIGRIGLFVAIIPFIAAIYGIVHGRFNFQVNQTTLEFNHLPKAFDGFKIVHISDFHAGSLHGQQSRYAKAFDLINRQNPDIIVFTGDMVNNTAAELSDWVIPMSVLKAKFGKFSILGNHDYGDYYRWPDNAAKVENLETLMSYQEQMGFKLLLNEAFVLQRDSNSIAILGVENWGKKPFPQHGRLDLALKGAEHVDFKILLSHDPTHWEQEVYGKTDIALTLSGHTHGMQMAINIAGFSWSPVSFLYPRWKGLYHENGQYLYINIGLGYIGFPGRIGTDPEITVIELKSKNESL